MKKIAMSKNTNSEFIIRGLSLLTVFFSLSFGSSNIPPFNDYCEMLEKDINGIQHGFLKLKVFLITYIAILRSDNF